MPLFLCWVDSCWIMSTYMQHDYSSLLDWRKLSHHPFKVKHSIFGVEVGVLVRSQTSISQNSWMISPCRIRNQYRWGRLKEFSYKSRSKSQCTSSRNRLNSGHTIIIPSKNDTLSELTEFSVTTNWQVFFVLLRIIKYLPLNFLNNIENIRLLLFSSICSYPQIHLLRVSVSFVGCDSVEDSIRWS